MTQRFAEESSCYQKNIIPKTEVHIVLHVSRVGLAILLDLSWVLSLQPLRQEHED